MRAVAAAPSRSAVRPTVARAAARRPVSVKAQAQVR